MANRNQYTPPPSGYPGNRQQGGKPDGAATRQPQPQPRQPVYRQPPRKARPMKDLLVFAAMLFVIPLLGIIGVFFQPFLWIFIIVSALCLAFLWVFRCFTQGSRAFLSGVLLTFAGLALVAAIDLSPTQGDYPVYGGDTYVQTQTAGTTGNTSQVNNPAFAGLGSLAATPTAPVTTGQESAPWEDGSTADGGADAQLANLSMTADTPNTADTTANTATQPLGYAGEAQTVLESYLQAWKSNEWEVMALYTTPSWRKAQKALPQQQLFWNHNWWILESWTITSEASSTSSTLAAFKVVTDVRKNNSARSQVRMAYDVLVLNESGSWYVDPDSISNGVPVVDPTEAPQDEGAVMEGGVNPTATPAPSVTSKTTLWYNSKGGKRYHIEERCPSIGEEYYSNMKKFTYGELDKSAYKNLIPCSTCNAPEKE